MLHTKYQSSWPYGFREEDFLRFYYEKLISPRAGPFWARGHNLNKLGKAPLGDATYQISKLLALWFRRRRFFKIIISLDLLMGCNPDGKIKKSWGRGLVWFELGLTSHQHRKVIQRRGPRFKVSSDWLVERGNRTSDPWVSSAVRYPLHHGTVMNGMMKRISSHW